MRILIINNHPPPLGGAEYHVELLSELMCSKGHEVVLYFPYEHYASHTLSKVTDSFKKVLSEQFDVAHIHNLDYKFSYIVEMLWRKGVKVVQTLHDYRYICPTGSFFRNGKICRECEDGKFFNAAVNGCFNFTLSLKRYLWETVLKKDPLAISKISAFISPSQGLARIMKESGFPAEITHIYNFLELSDYEFSAEEKREPYVLFLGRLTRDKGIMTLLRAVHNTGVKLKIAGRGELESDIASEITKDGYRVEMCGFMQGKPLKKLIAYSSFVVVPSEWLENLPFSVIESFALSKSVIGSDMGGIPDLLSPGFGTIFKAGDAEDLRAKILSASEDLSSFEKMGRKARAFVEREMSPEVFYNKIMTVYNRE